MTGAAPAARSISDLSAVAFGPKHQCWFAAAQQNGKVAPNLPFPASGATSVSWRAAAHYGDRFFYQMLKRQPFIFASVQKPTVNYHCLWQSLYSFLNEPFPVGAKPSVDASVVAAWLRGRDAREREIVQRLTGVTVEFGK